MRTTARPEGEEIDVALARARRAWLQAMGPHASSSRHAVLPEIAMLQQSHLNGCTILANREVLIDRMRKNGIAVELGVDKGFFSEVIMRVAQPERLHLVDMDFSRFDPEKKLDRHVQDGRVLLHRGDSAKVISGFPPRHFDFVYIDADHSYRGVLRDIDASVDKVKDDGFLIFNDYTYWSPWECMPYGVMQAVNELCFQDSWEVAYFALGQFMYCDIALRRKQRVFV